MIHGPRAHQEHYRRHRKAEEGGPGIELTKVVPHRGEFRPRYFKRGQLTRLILDFMRNHAGESVAVADIMPVAVGEWTLNSAE